MKYTVGLSSCNSRTQEIPFNPKLLIRDLLRPERGKKKNPQQSRILQPLILGHLQCVMGKVPDFKLLCQVII